MRRKKINIDVEWAVNNPLIYTPKFQTEMEKKEWVEYVGDYIDKCLDEHYRSKIGGNMEIHKSNENYGT